MQLTTSLRNGVKHMEKRHAYITYYDQMPIPADMACTELFEAGDVAFGVQFRTLTDELVAAQSLVAASGNKRGKVTGLNDYGVALHVFDNTGPKMVECLRFDCFHGEAHYHYVNWAELRNEMAYMDPVAFGDPLAWSLNAIRTRLACMIECALGSSWTGTIDSRLLDQVLPQVAASAYRARFHSTINDSQI